MKKWRVLLTCFMLLVIIVRLCIDIYIDSLSVYWVVVKLACLVLILAGSIVRVKQDKDYSILYAAVIIFAWALFLGYNGYRDIAVYRRNVRLEKFGWALNQRRRMLGVPEIPANWHVKFKGDRSVDWEGDTSRIGHEYKLIFIDSIYRIELEEDEYKMKPINGKKRYVSVTTHYARGKGRDSVDYSYEVADSNRTITSKQADSLFAAEKINKN